MFSRRSAALVFGGCLTLGGVAASTGSAYALDSAPSSTVPAPVGAEPYSFTIPGVGTLALTLDPATGVVSDVLVTPVDGMTAGTPEVSGEGVKVAFTAADGTIHVVEAEVKRRDGVLRIETEVELEDEGEHHNDDGEHHQEDKQGRWHENANGDGHFDNSGHGRGAGRSNLTPSQPSDDSGRKARPEPKVEDHGVDESHQGEDHGGRGRGRSGGNDHEHDVTTTTSPSSDDSGS
jgi:hypothetical protein